jgi:hypothetical protein
MIFDKAGRKLTRKSFLYKWILHAIYEKFTENFNMFWKYLSELGTKLIDDKREEEKVNVYEIKRR